MICSKEKEIGGRRLLLETGKVAKQADGAVWVRYGDTVILATVVASNEPVENKGFLPLTVEYREKAYAAGKIPGGFFKREGRPSEKEIVSARLTDRSIRPLFPKNFRNEIQIIISVLSADGENDADILGTIGASTSLMLAGIPFKGPIAAVRVGKIGKRLLLNPTFSQLEASDMDIVIAGSRDSIIMVEGSAKEISEGEMLEALHFGLEAIRDIISLEEEIAENHTKERIPFEEVPLNEELVASVHELAFNDVLEAIGILEKNQRRSRLEEIAKDVYAQLEDQFPESEAQIAEIIGDIERSLVRKMILEEGRRLDGRGLTDIRPISCEVGVLPRAHGSALFTRGQTQSLAAVTLGTKMDEQKIEGLEGDFWKSYMLHYNFPPFCVGEIRPIRGPERREIGHGFLAERALKPMIPSEEVFPYTIRVVSDILESNGSSSMATVCSGSLSLMDAGVPVKDSVAGIAMGLVKEGEKAAILTDILGDEDHIGDMDFKVAGSRNGITAVQMDIKIEGVSFEIIQKALNQAKEARLYTLDIMDKTLDKPRPQLSAYAPRIISMKVPVEHIGIIIGPGGKTIREIIDKTGATIDIEDDGTITIATVDEESGQRAKKIIESLTQEPEVGKTYIGKVKRVMNYGALVEILPGREGLLHISEISPKRINRVEDVLKVGDEVEVKLMKIEPDGRLDLSRKAIYVKRDFHPERKGRFYKRRS